MIRRRAGFTLVELMVVTVMVGILASIGLRTVDGAIQRARVARATAEIRSIERAIMSYDALNQRLPGSLTEAGVGEIEDPWGSPYQYVVLQGAKGGKGKARKDRFLVPLNSDFDLYSMGADGESTAPLTAKASRDDIIRAADGGYVGPAEGF